MNRNINLLAAIGLAIGAGFGMSGSFVSDPVTQIVLYEISSVGLTAACVLLGIKFLRDQQDIIAAGFLLFAIAEAVMTAGAALGQVGGQPSFGAGMALYVPSFLLISIPKGFQLWNRITGIAAAIPFAIGASKIFLGELVPSTSALPGAGYGLLTITIIGWIITLLRERNQN